MAGSMLSVQFSDASKDTIVSYFNSPQDSTAFLFQGQVDVDDPRYKTYYESLPAVCRQGMPLPILT